MLQRSVFLPAAGFQAQIQFKKVLFFLLFFLIVCLDFDLIFWIVYHVASSSSKGGPVAFLATLLLKQTNHL